MSFTNKIQMYFRISILKIDFVFTSLLSIFFQAVIVFLLIIAGVETNTDPNPPTYSIIDVQSSMNHLSITSSISAMVYSSISFHHLSIQSFVPKLDLISSEYADFYILSFSKLWLNRGHTDESLKLSNYLTPFRKDTGPNKLGVWFFVCKGYYNCKQT